MTGWIADRIRRAATLRLAIWVAAALLCAWILSAAWPTVSDCLRAPFEADARYLEAHATERGLPRSFVRVTGSSVQAFGVDLVETTTKGRAKKSRVVSHYWALQVGDRWLIVELESAPSTTVVGRLERIDAALRQELVKSADRGSGVDRFYPLHVTTEDRAMEAWAILLVVVGGLCACGWIAAKSARLMFDPSRHPAALRAAAWDPSWT